MNKTHIAMLLFLHHRFYRRFDPPAADPDA
jgi:hypothetical protein